jgi:tetratricopeptide (TPR) repeat protein
MTIRKAIQSLVLAGLLLLCPAARSGQKPWIEVRSPNFRVLTDVDANSGRRIAREFEQMRSVFERAFPKMRLDTGAPLVIFAPRDEYSMKAMAPETWKAKGPKPAGFFQHGWERQYAVVRLDQDIPGKYEVVYHEYVHTLLHANFQWLPTWLDEGLAEFYGNTRFGDKKMNVGAPSTRVFELRGRTLIPLDELISENPWVKFRRDEIQLHLFYSEAWALVHYLIFGPGMEQGAKLSRFNDLLQKGAPQKKSFEEVFGDFKELENALSQYVNKFLFLSYEMETPPHIQEKDFPSRTLSVAETDAELGTYRLWSHDRQEARESIEQAIKDDPRVALSHETLAFLDFTDGKDADAGSEFGKAYESDRQRYLSLYYRTMLSGLASSTAPADELSFRSAMYDVLKLNPRFAPVYVQLAFAYARHGDLTNALTMARRAEGLEPTRAGYHLLSGRILLKLGREEEAARQASFVAERWKGPDHDEAVELLNQVPAEKRGEIVTAIVESPGETKLAAGTLSSLTCGERGAGATVVIENQNGKHSFHSKGFQMVGYSDTVWYGSDHFTLCHHLDGLRAIVRYKASTEKESEGDWVELMLRQDLPLPLDKRVEAAGEVKK